MLLMQASLPFIPGDDGLLGNTFSYNSAYQDKNGRMYFGMVNGLLAFNPAEIKESNYNPPVYFY